VLWNGDGRRDDDRPARGLLREPFAALGSADSEADAARCAITRGGA
jgi:hypothetical protein